jgi:hypothetical protein
MTAAMPAYRHLARREKEAELVFRGEQYARAIALYRAKNGNNFPASIDVLVQGKYLRKKYKDPMTKDGEFRLVPVGNPQGGPPQGGPGQPPAGGRGPGSGGPGTAPQGAPPGLGRGPQPQPQPPAGPTGSFISGGIMGVASKSDQTSIRIYKGQTKYNMWPFTFNMVNRPGGQPGPGQPGGPGAQQPGVGPGTRPGGRGPGGRGPTGPGGRGTGPGRGMGPGRGDAPIQIPGRGGRGPGL